MLGVIGVENRMQGTVISNTVNLTSRIESLTKLFGSSLLISNKVLSKIKNSYSTRFLGNIIVLGKSDKVEIYEILSAEHKDICQKKMESKPFFEQGLALYFEKRFSEASVQFTLSLKAYPDDKPAQLYLKNCANYMVNGVPNDWDGSMVILEK